MMNSMKMIINFHLMNVNQIYLLLEYAYLKLLLKDIHIQEIKVLIVEKMMHFLNIFINKSH